jgi:sterol desaturase/sphingolipid hydroxylase (fatty acid hydroxylase superfamily)
MNITLCVAIAALFMIVAERAWPGRRWPRVRGWWPRALAASAVQVSIVLAAGLTWDTWFQRWQPWSADALGTPGGALLGYLAITFVYYWWHRARHEVPCLWRWLHQLHHSPQRLEVVTSFYKHPLELAANGVLSSAILYLIVGVGPAAASLAVLLTGLAELFYHWNVRTPHWLGFLVQRPESHCVHHQAELHAWNYADLPVWDALFGTLRNPRAWNGSCGFGHAEHRLGAMLRGVDVVAGEEAR